MVRRRYHKLVPKMEIKCVTFSIQLFIYAYICFTYGPTHTDAVQEVQTELKRS